MPSKGLLAAVTSFNEYRPDADFILVLCRSLSVLSPACLYLYCKAKNACRKVKINWFS